MATWVHLSTYLLIVLQTYLFEIPRQRIKFFLFKKGKAKKEWLQLYIIDTQNLMLLQHQYVAMPYGHSVDIKEAKGLIDNLMK